MAKLSYTTILSQFKKGDSAPCYSARVKHNETVRSWFEKRKMRRGRKALHKALEEPLGKSKKPLLPRYTMGNSRLALKLGEMLNIPIVVANESIFI